jgi:hypothetical protein
MQVRNSTKLRVFMRDIILPLGNRLNDSSRNVRRVPRAVFAALCLM